MEQTCTHAIEHTVIHILQYVLSIWRANVSFPLVLYINERLKPASPRKSDASRHWIEREKKHSSVITLNITYSRVHDEQGHLNSSSLHMLPSCQSPLLVTTAPIHSKGTISTISSATCYTFPPRACLHQASDNDYLRVSTLRLHGECLLVEMTCHV